MRAFEVIITPAAEADAQESFSYIHERSPQQAKKWLEGLYLTFSKLTYVHGHGRAGEAELLGVDLRQVVFKSHRVLYTVDKRKRVVHVHHVRHGARRRIGERPDLDER